MGTEQLGNTKRQPKARHRRPGHARRPLRALVGAIATLAIGGIGVGLTGIVAPTPALASDLVQPATSIRGNYGNAAFGGGTRLGRYVNHAARRSTDYVLCISSGAADQVRVDSQQVQWGGDWARLGWAMWRYINDSSNNNPQALAYLAKSHFDTGNGSSSAANSRSQVIANTPQNIKDRAGTIWNEASRYLGPYTMSVALDSRSGATASIRVKLRSSAGYTVPGQSVALSVKGPGGTTWPGGGTVGTYVTSGSADGDVIALKLGGAGTFTVTASASNLSAAGSLLQRQNQTGYQATVTVVPDMASVSAQTSFSITKATGGATTQSSVTGTAVGLGTSVYDTISATGLWPGDAMPVTATLYWVSAASARPAQSAAKPAGARAVYTWKGTLPAADAAGRASAKTPTYTLKAADGAGWFTWQLALGATGNTAAFTSDFLIPAESFYVAPRKPAISTKASATGNLAVGAGVTDTISATNLWPGEVVSVTATLWKVSAGSVGLPAQSSSPPTGAKSIWTWKGTLPAADAAGKATRVTPVYTIKAADGAGWYSWRVEVAASANVSAYASNFSIPAESFRVPPLAPTIQTTSSTTGEARAGSGETVHDSITLAGGFPGDTVNVTYTLYSTGVGPDDARPPRAAVPPAGFTAVYSGSGTTTFSAAGQAKLTTGNYTVADGDLGWYSWRVQVAATANTVATGSDFNVPSEMFVVVRRDSPQLRTTTSDQVAEAGGRISDTLQVDAAGYDLAANPAHIVSRLWGPFTSRPAAQAEWPDDQSLLVGTVESWADASGTYVTQSLPVAQPGYYTWTASLSPSDPCPPAGGAGTDSTGGGDADGGGAPSESGDDGGTETGGNGTETGVGNGSGEENGESGGDLGGQGCGPAPYKEFRSLFGEAAETTVVPWQPRVTTTTSQAIAEPGSNIADHLEVSDGRPGAQYVVRSTLYGPFVDRPVVADAAPVEAPVVGTTTTVVAIGPDGRGSGLTEEFELPAHGFYVWVESIDQAADGSSKSWRGRFGEVDETSLVPYRPTIVSTASSQIAEPGAAISDVLEITGMRPGGGGEIRTTLYGPFAEDPTRNYDGDGTFTDQVLLPLGDDQAGDQPGQPDHPDDADEEDGITAGSASGQGDDSVVSQGGVNAGGQGAVTAAGQGGVTATGQDGPVAAGPTAQVDSAVPSSAPVMARLDSRRIEADEEGRAELTTHPVVVEAGGFYVWVSTLVPDDELQTSTVELFGEVRETTFVPYEPVISTRASHAVATPGTGLYDVVTVTGLPSNSPRRIEASLYGPLDSAPERSALPPAGTPLAGVLSFEVRGDGTYETEPIVVGQLGYYVWVERILAAPDSTHGEVVTDYGIVEETSLVKPFQPHVATHASSQVAQVGAVLTDKLVVAGLPDQIAPVAVTSVLYGPFEKAPVESDTVPDGAPVAGVVVTSVTGNGNFTTSGIVAEAVGYYTWIETIEPSVEYGYDGWTGRFGIEAETTVVTQTPPSPPPPFEKVLAYTGASGPVAAGAATAGLLVLLGTVATVSARRRRVGWMP